MADPIGPQFLPASSSPPPSEVAPLPAPVETDNLPTATSAMGGTPTQPPQPTFEKRMAGHFADAISKFAPPTVDYVPDGKGGTKQVTHPGGLANIGKAVLSSAIAAFGGSQMKSPAEAEQFALQTNRNAGIGQQANADKRAAVQSNIKAQQAQQEITDRHTIAMGTIKYNELKFAKDSFELSQEEAAADQKLASNYEQSIASAHQNGQDVVELPTLKDAHQLADPEWQAAHPQYAKLIQEYAAHEWQLIPRVSTDANGKPIHEGVALIKAPSKDWLQNRIGPDDTIALGSPYYNKDKKGIDVYGLDPANPKGPVKVAYTAPLGTLKGSDLEIIRSKNDQTLMQHDKDVNDVKLSEANLKVALNTLKEQTDSDSKLSKAIGDLTTAYKTTDDQGRPVEGSMLRPDAAARVPIINRLIDTENKGKKPEDQLHHIAVSKDGNSLIDATTNLPFGQEPAEESAPVDTTAPAVSDVVKGFQQHQAEAQAAKTTNDEAFYQRPGVKSHVFKKAGQGQGINDVESYILQHPEFTPEQRAQVRHAAEGQQNTLKPPTPGAKIDAGTVQKYIQAAKGNVQAARVAATNDGWSLQ